MTKTLERYQRCSYGALEVNQPAIETERCYQEYLKLKSKVEALQRTQRNLLGEELEHLGMKELEQLERSLDSSLRQIRSNKTQHMLEQLYDLQRKEEILVETNKALRSKFDDINIGFQPSWEARDQNAPYYEPPQCNSPLQIGYGSAVTSEAGAVAGTSAQNANEFMQGWLS